MHNNCGNKQCYRVEQDWTGDQLESVAAYATEEDSYSTTFFGQGKRIYGASCTG
ncbi:hypothetical protein GCM10009745_43070 [Kribbella yunnanensis]|uniref:Uncharacterized protein n=1 Tax=Kribbella yunnanensis TaxID=190194 RepID=A0ABN2HT30_9ACTN